MRRYKVALRSASLAVVTLALACSSSGDSGDGAPEDASSADASQPEAPPSQTSSAAARAPVPMPATDAAAKLLRRSGDATPEHAALSAIRSLVSKDAGLVRALREATGPGDGLALDPEGFTSQAWRAPAGALDRIGAVFPHRAVDVWRVGPARVPGSALALQPVGFRSVAGVLDAGRVVYPDALPHADVIAVSRAREAELFVVLKDAEAKPEVRWKLHLGADLLRTRRLASGAIDFVDATGEAALRIQPAYAVDATGKHVDATMELDGDELSVKVDPTGLAYPVVLDPVVEVPIWQLVSSTTLPVMKGNGLVYSSGLARTISLGGSSGSGWGCPAAGTYNSVVHTWNGTTWSTMAGASFPRYEPSVASFGTGAILFGGCTDSATLGDTWRLSGSTWSLVCASGACGVAAANGAPMAYLPGYGAVLFTGDEPGMPGRGSTYVYNGGSSWTKRAYTGAETANVFVPPVRRWAVMSADTSAEKILLFGGSHPTTNNGPALADAWVFDYKATGTVGSPAWTAVCGPGSAKGCPLAPRYRGGAAFDAARKKHVVFGGSSGTTALIKDTWEYDSVTGEWTELCASCAPTRRATNLVYDASRRRLVTAAGENVGHTNETYELYVRGGSCASDAECDTGHCVEGTCCESVCGTCQTCADPSSPGVCKNVTAGVSDPLGRCPGGGQCNGAGACRAPLGSACASASECASGNCVASTCCATSSCGAGLTCANASGTCRKVIGATCVTGTECASGDCVDGVCCSSSSCPANARCDYPSAPGTCRRNNGQPCAASTDCGSSFCVDGYCCNGACTAQCAACDVVKGTCTPVVGAPHGSRAACAGSGPCASTCNGSDPTACKYPGSSISCGSTSCTGGTVTNTGACDGSGACVQPTASCGAYACGASACKTSCSTNADCASGHYCKTGACVVKEAAGVACTSAASCASGSCVDGVCCATASCAAGSACNGASAPGTCTAKLGQTCATAAQCGSGFCVDGVCCDGACSGRCQACNLASAPGKCSNVIGAPVGGRPACGGVGAGTTCGARCDGTSPSTCAFPGSSTSCGAASCASGAATGAGSCDGAGTCLQPTTACGAYACGATACKTTCATNGDCASGFYCKAGACSAKEVDGAACTSAATCASGSCVDGVCCNTSSCATGLRCNVAGALGRCSKPLGVACTTSAECGSGFCVDGVCCDTACSGQCQACDVSGSVGTCRAATGKPHGARLACAGAGAGTECGPRCDGADGSACHYPTGTQTCGANTCVAGVETHVSTCNGGGACSDVPATCGAFVCDATACKRGCTTNADCAAGNYCKSGACIAIEGLGTSCTTASTCTSGFCTDGVCCASGSCGAGKSCSAGAIKGVCKSLLGTACKANDECASGFCVDGVCCNTDCGGACEACNLPTSLGSCAAIVGDPLTGHPPCSASPTDPECGLRCDGSDGKACKPAATTVSCGTASCALGVEDGVSTCDGAGACKPAKKSCGAYACGPTACLTSCTTNTDCATGSYCKAGACTFVEALGVKCTADAECASGHCTDGVCCNETSCGEGSSCASIETTKPGECLKKKGITCTGAADCATGHCVDGVCCDAACNGQCEACDVAGSEGQCTAVVGAPHGARAACDALAPEDCARRSCNGKERTRCDGYANGATVKCGAESCTPDKKLQKRGVCDGDGGCAVPEPTSCVEYACDPSKPACFGACATNEQCGDAFVCDVDSGKCVQGAHCSADRTESIDKTGAPTRCAPFLCGTDGKCMKQCATSDDCVAGTVCDVSTNACTGVAPTADESSGCGCAIPGAERGPARWAVLLGVAAIAARRRRRATRDAA